MYSTGQGQGQAGQTPQVEPAVVDRVGAGRGLQGKDANAIRAGDGPGNAGSRRRRCVRGRKLHHIVHGQARRKKSVRTKEAKVHRFKCLTWRFLHTRIRWPAALRR